MIVTDATNVLRILGDVDRFLVRFLDPVLHDMGLAREHWQVLRLLDGGRGHPMGEIARSLQLPSATATRLVDLLVTNMFAYRRSDPLDRRRVLVQLSDTGSERLRRIEEALRGSTSAGLTGLSADERKRLVELFDRFLEASASGDEQASKVSIRSQAPTSSGARD